MKSRVIAVSAIAAAFTAIILTVGTYIDLIDLCCMVLSSAFVCTPLCLNSYKGATLCYLAGGVIAAIATLPKLFSGFAIVIIAYFFFFGIFPIVNAKMIEKKIAFWIRTVIGALWFVATVFGVFFYYKFVTGLSDIDFVKSLGGFVYPILAAAAILFYFVFEKFVRIAQMLTGKYASRYFKSK